MRELEYPFDAELNLKKKKRLRRELLAVGRRILSGNDDAVS